MEQYNKGKQGFCTWCKDRNQPEEVYKSHTTFDEETGILTCPRLQPEFEEELRKNERKERYRASAHLMQPSAKWHRGDDVPDISSNNSKKRKKSEIKGPRSFEELMAEKKMRQKWNSQRKAAYAKQAEEKEREERSQQAKLISQKRQKIEAGKAKALRPGSARKSAREDVSSRPHPDDVNAEQDLAVSDFEIPKKGDVVKSESEKAARNGIVKSETNVKVEGGDTMDQKDDDSPRFVKRGRGFQKNLGEDDSGSSRATKRIRRH